jgi:adenine C2-methylase RlmN of 23S rRNA A2503 and tRNA A37
MAGLGNIDDVYRHYLVVIEENKKLKELLKECRVYVENCEQFNAYDFEMLKTIDNAIGEKK